MDNVTHTLAGLAVGELAWRRARSPTPALRSALWTVSAIANNVPDFDFIYSKITSGPLGYLLHHRGHTHTLLLAVPQSALLFALCWWLARKRGIVGTVRDWGWVAAVAVIGPFLHVAMDAMNSYGVHPFWPFNNQWYYGDAIFIVEPLLWTSLALPLLFVAHRWWARALLLSPVIAGPFLGWSSKMMAPFALWGLGAFTLVLVAILRRLSDRGRAVALVLMPMAVIATFMLAGAKVRRDLAAEPGKEGERIVDIVLSPMPANPLCWLAVVIRTDGKTVYRARKGRASALPSLLDAGRCTAFRPLGIAPLADVPQPGRHVRWYGELQGNLAELRRLASERCDLAAYLRFSRAPFLLFSRDGGLAGDLRFDANGGRSGFWALPLPAKVASCPGFVPPWIPPARWAR